MRDKKGPVELMLKRKESLVLILILAVTFIAYAGSLKNGFTKWDDPNHLLENPSVRSLDAGNIAHIFKSTVHATYIPLTILSFAVEYHFFEYNPFVYHLDNIILHLIVTGLVFLFALRIGLTLRAAGIAALLFGVHPMHVEAVSWVTARKDVLYAPFYMLALCWYLRYLESGKKSTYAFTVLFGLLSILAKPMALSLPLILFVCDWLKGRKFTVKAILDKIPHFIYIIPVTWMTYSLNTRVPEVNLLEGALTWIWTLTFYIQKFLFPFILLPLYQLPKPVSVFSYPYAVSICVLFLTSFCIVRYKKNRWLMFAFLYYFLSMFFLFRFDDVVDVSIVADRYAYLPSLGPCVFFGVFAGEILDGIRKKNSTTGLIVRVCLIAVLSALIVKTHLQNRVWKNNFTVWDYVIGKSPDNAIAYNNRGIWYADTDQNELALADYTKALAIDAHYADAYFNRGILYTEERRYDLALSDYNNAIANDKEHAKAYTNRGILYKKQGRYELAFADYDKAVAIDPKYAEGYINRGIIYAKQGLNTLAMADFNRAIDIDPRDAESYVNRALTYAAGGDHDLALADIERALNVEPDSVGAYHNKGIIHGMKGEYDFAIMAFNRALEIDPRHAVTYLNRSFGYAFRGDAKKALEDALWAQSLGVKVDSGYIVSLQETVRKNSVK